MRKDVRTGAVIGGLLIAVLILYGVVASRSHKKPGSEPVALGTDKTTPDAPGAADHPDGAAPDPTPAAPDAGATPAPNPGASASTGIDSANPGGSKPDTAAAPKTGVSWAALLRADNVENLMPVQSQTPDPSIMDVGPRTGAPRPPVSEAPPTSPRRSAAGDGDAVTTVGPPPSPEGAASTNYTVKSGDTLSSIARATYGDARYYKKIMAANPKLNPNRMRPGAVIILPGKSQIAHESSSSDSATASSDSPARHSAPKPVAPVDSSTEYRVASNDSLYRISMKLYHTPNKVDLIYQFNKTLIGPDPARLKLGMVLKLPEPPTQPASTREIRSTVENSLSFKQARDFPREVAGLQIHCDFRCIGIVSSHPAGMPAISRASSAATPPERDRIFSSTPEGVAALVLQRTVPKSRHAATPFRVALYCGSLSGGIAALNHRLMALTPPGLFRRKRFSSLDETKLFGAFRDTATNILTQRIAVSCSIAA